MQRSGKGGALTGIQQRISSSLPLIIKILLGVELTLAVLIFFMEIGIIFIFDTYSYLFSSFFRLVKELSVERWWTINAITQSILFVLTIILIEITGNYVNTHGSTTSLYCSSTSTSSDAKYACSKYQLHQAQLAFAILMFFAALTFLGFFLYLRFLVKRFPEATTSTKPVSHVTRYPSTVPPLYTSKVIVPPTSGFPTTIRQDTSVTGPIKEITCPHCQVIIPLPVPKRTY
ncbi:unnamed protein product [Didymodactylos carnosus]|uniref:Uncharacterized protein n=1 Tax=Didymodactylos carnosus TaxID=1234261 RepID=A0A815QW67_9BILA|nr:unnamed protein product [Didymodactylos carnosus]CAF1467768.1 unnamed protein product [Didymodactylos carnosus]CAF3978641.1 unnamed protein product [Didymodactylos carnosus]CAF4336464.1 unnamed protein product [Didymodactylos carnosus]